MLVHLDTDIGGDPDDACAFVMLAGWPGVQQIAITTNLDQFGERAGCADVYRRLLGAPPGAVSIVAGAAVPMTTLLPHESTAGDERYWNGPVRALPAVPGVALDELRQSIAAGAVVVAIGALTNLALLEVMWPGTLADARVVMMGGWVTPPHDGLPPWGPETDFNVQVDTRATEIVFERAGVLTLVTLPAAMDAHLRASDLDALRATGPAGALLARQSEVHAADHAVADLARLQPALPADLVNFHWDPVTVAVALGWDGATIERRRLVAHTIDGVLRFFSHPNGRDVDVVTRVDGDAFRPLFVERVARATRRFRRSI